MEANNLSIFRVLKSNVPYLPDWLFKRPHLNHNSITSSMPGYQNPPVPAGSQSRSRIEEPQMILGNFPVEIQETFLIEDLLYAMNGIEGVFIKRR